MSENKMLFFDIDGTLAIHRHIPKENMDALKALREKGYLTFICTGRPAFYPEELFGSVVSGFVCCNGCSIEFENETLMEYPIDEDHIEFIKKYARDNQIGVLFAIKEGVIPYNFNNEQEKMTADMYGLDKIFQSSDSSICTYDLYFDRPDQFEKIQRDLSEIIVLNSHLPHPSCDCSIPDWNKGNAIAWLQNYFGISKENTYAFGDGMNDLSMFDHAGHCIAMGNAVDALKEKADFVTLPVDQNGIFHALVHEGLLEE